MRLNEINIKEHMPSEKSVKTYSIATRLTLSLMAMVMFVVLFPIGWSYRETDRQARHTLSQKPMRRLIISAKSWLLLFGILITLLSRLLGQR